MKVIAYSDFSVQKVVVTENLNDFLYDPVAFYDIYLDVVGKYPPYDATDEQIIAFEQEYYSRIHFRLGQDND